MPQELLDLDVDEVSLVDRPANQEAVIAIFKRDKTEKKVNKSALPTSIFTESAPAMSTVTKRQPLEGVVSFKKSADEVVEVRKEDFADAMDVAGQEADDGISPLMNALHDRVQEINAADAAPEEKSQAITKIFQEAMMVLDAGINGTEDEPGLIEKCLVTGAILVQKLGPAPKAEDKKGAEGDKQDDSVEKKDTDMPNDPEVAELRKQLSEMKDKERLGEIRDELRKAHVPLENAELVLKLEKADKDAAAAMLKSLLTMGGQVQKAASLTKEIGAAGGDIIRKADRLKAAAEDIRKNEPKLTEAQAITKALETNADLRAAYEAGEI